MNIYYSRVPAAAIHLSHDGRRYVYVPHRFDGARNRFIEDFSAPRLLKFTEPESFIKNGEAFILIGKSGDLVPVPACLPFGVTATRTP